MPHRERYLFVCTNRRDADNPKGSCAAKHSEELLKKLKGSLASRGMKGRVRVCESGCLDLCEIGAAMVMEPEHVAYGNVVENDLEEILDGLVSGKPVERLVVFPKKD